MKLIKQHGQDFAGFDYNAESIADGILYNPKNRKLGQSRLASKKTAKCLGRIMSVFQHAFDFRMDDFKLYYIGQSHCDAAWLWTVLETKIRIYKTFYKALEHMDLYPFFKFSQTSPQYYQWVKSYSPSMWEKVKERVKEGRWELTGGMWVEPDLDNLWGESLVRQRLYGQLFYLREFGKIAEVESLLDVFGYPWSLPQILVRSGAKYFWTTKNTWNDTNLWPISNYMWQGLDGSQIFTHQFRFNLMAAVGMKDYYKMGRLPKEGYKKEVISSHKTNAEIEFLMSTERTKELGLFYGWGDGARGPWEIEIQTMEALCQNGWGKHSNTLDFFNELKASVEDDYLVWNDEAYLETHRGTKTTQLEIKYYNRLAEMWAYLAESFVTIANLNSPYLLPYYRAEIVEMWRKILFNQFHDILPGSSIPDVYILAVKEQKDAIQSAKNLIYQVMGRIPCSDEEFLVYNPFSWPRSEYVSISTAEGNRLAYFNNIPGYTLSFIKKQSAIVHPSKLNSVVETDFEYILENESIKAEIDKMTGSLCSLVYKPLLIELIDPSKSRRKDGCGFRAYHDNPKTFPAWNIDKSYGAKPIKINLLRKPQIQMDLDGTTWIYVEFKALKSKLTVAYALRPNDNYLRMKIHTEMKNPEVLIKFFIPLTIKSEKITAEIPYGVIDRSRNPKSEMERAKWECPMQKWIDVSDKTHGMTIVNNNRYGYSANMHGIYLTLTRTAKYPTPGFYSTHRAIPKRKIPKHTDMYPFDYEFGLYPHKGTWNQCDAWQLGYNFNLPLLTQDQITLPTFSLKEMPMDGQNLTGFMKNFSKSFITCDKENIFVGAIKAPEWIGKTLGELVVDSEWSWNQSYFIIRIIEQAGMATNTKISFGPQITIKAAVETDLLERPDAQFILNKKPIPAQNNTIDLIVAPFEIKTLRIEIQPKIIKPTPKNVAKPSIKANPKSQTKS